MRRVVRLKQTFNANCKKFFYCLWSNYLLLSRTWMDSFLDGKFVVQVMINISTKEPLNQPGLRFSSLDKCIAYTNSPKNANYFFKLCFQTVPKRRFSPVVWNLHFNIVCEHPFQNQCQFWGNSYTQNVCTNFGFLILRSYPIYHSSFKCHYPKTLEIYQIFGYTIHYTVCPRTELYRTFLSII